MSRHAEILPNEIAILDYIRAFQKDHGYPPSIREIGNEVGVSSTSQVNYYLDKLADRRLIERTPNVSRGIRVLVQEPRRKPRWLRWYRRTPGRRENSCQPS